MSVLGFQPSFRGVLLGAGYVGEATIVAPPDSLEAELLELSQSGGSPLVTAEVGWQGMTVATLSVCRTRPAGPTAGPQRTPSGA